MSSTLLQQIELGKSQIQSIQLILDAANLKAQPRDTLPNKLAHLPIIRHKRVQGLLLKIYNFLFKEQRTTQLNTIYALQELSRVSEHLLEHIKQLKQQLAQTTQRLDQSSLSESCTTLLKAHSEQIRYLQANLSQQQRTLAQVAPVEHTELTAISQGVPTGSAVSSTHALDHFYQAFEDEFRGSSTLIRERLQKYLPLLSEAGLVSGSRILDIGCGRGEWLGLLREHHYAVTGLDLNTAMVEHCQQAGLDVIEADALAYLQALPDASLDAITGFHIVEHLPFENLVVLAQDAFRVLRPGGIILLETPNPRNVLVGSFSFYLDPTHRNPIPFELLWFVLKYCGFGQVRPLWANPSDLPKVAEDSELARRFNELFYGFMDYAVMGVKG
jgi:O-antigen chain-terminating methyltransferase